MGNRWWSWARKFRLTGDLLEFESRIKESELRIRARIDKHAEFLRLIHEQQGQILELMERNLDRRLRRLEHTTYALLRARYVADRDLPMPQALLAKRFGILSQNEEDGILLALFDLVGASTRRFVELGSGTNGGNSGLLALDCGWAGLMLDGSADRVAALRRRFHTANVVADTCWITRENVNDVLRQHGFTGDIDLISIDVDGIDYWLWDALEAASPRVVVAEYNASFGYERAVTVPYDPRFDRHRFDARDYYGASLQAWHRLAGRRGYRLVALEPRGVNAFFVRDDVAGDIPALTIPSDLPPLHPEDETIFDACHRLRLPLVEV